MSDTPRDEEMYQAYRKHRNLSKLARRYHLSVERCRQIVGGMAESRALAKVLAKRREGINADA